MKKLSIIQVEANSIAQELGLQPGDCLLSINDKPILDVFDYRFLMAEENINILIQKPDGEEWLFEVEKEEDEDIGLVFATDLMDDGMTCKNKCIFCFIDQLPKNMRETLYVKDDDSRLSFLQGNYTTLTNMTDEALSRIAFYHLSPINISVHTTDPDLRQMMLKNPKARDIISQITTLFHAGISLNFQIVLVKGVNDGVHLEKTMEDLVKFLPLAKSLSVVPVGLSRFRDENGLFFIEPFSKEDARAVLSQIEHFQHQCQKRFQTSFVFAADEWYLLEDKPIPKTNHYENFPQLENGVGMMALFEEQWYNALKTLTCKNCKQHITVVTGVLAYTWLKQLTKQLTERITGITIDVVAIHNHFFGERISVSGLLTGQDIVSQLLPKTLGDVVFVPQNAFRSGESVLLDSMTLQQLEEQLQTKVCIIPIDGEVFLNKLLETTFA